KWGSFNELQQNNYTALKEILEDAIVMESKKGSIDQLIGDFYFTFMDSTTRNELGVSPIMPYLDRVNNTKSKSEITALVADLHNAGISCLMRAGVQQDLKNNSIHRLYISQGGLGLPGKSYYTKTDDESINLQSDYKEHISVMLEFVVSGRPDTDMGV